MSLPNPLLKIFRTEKGVYVYSGHTNAVIRINDAIADILEHYERREKKEIFHSLCNKYTLPELGEGYSDIEKAHKEFGYFSSGTFKSRIKRMTEDEMKRLIGIEKIQNLTLAVTENCNFRCRYCTYSGGYKDQRTHSNKKMSLKTARAAIDFLHETVKDEHISCDCDYHSEKQEDNRIGLGFYGGEPFLEFNLIKKSIEYFESFDWGDKKIYHGMTTNGSLLSDDVIDFVLEKDIHLTFSLDGPKNIHDRARVFANGKGTFDTIFSNIKKIQEKIKNKEKRLGSINCIIQPGADLLELRNFFIENFDKDKTSIKFSFVNPKHQSYFKENPLHPHRVEQFQTLKDEYMEILKKGFDIDTEEHNFLENLLGGPFLDFYKRNIREKVEEISNLTGMCTPGTRKPVISVDGKIHVCEKLPFTMPIGDVWKALNYSKITKAWNQYAEIMDREECRTCWAGWFCTACFADFVSGDTIDNKKIEEIDCERVCSNALETMIDFCAIQEQKTTAFSHFKNYKIS